MGGLSNQGRPIGQLLEDVSFGDLENAAQAMWLEATRHPATATCECPVIEALGVLYEQGYRLVKLEQGTSTRLAEEENPSA